MLRARKHLLAISGFLALAAFTPHALAAGNVDSASKYAWGNTAGWVNFAPSNASITVSASSVAGYAWSANNGWLNLSPAQGGVTNDGTGTLGGFAWDSAAGWVSFVGVTIDSSGVFHGMAIGANGYQLNFDCTKCRVVTSWRVESRSGNHPRSGGSLIPISPNEATTSVPNAGAAQAGSALSGLPADGAPKGGSSSSTAVPANGPQEQSTASTTNTGTTLVHASPSVPIAESMTSGSTTAKLSPSAFRTVAFPAALGLLLVLLIIAWRVFF